MRRRSTEGCKVCGNTIYAKGLCALCYRREKHGISHDMPTLKKQNEYEIYGNIAIFTVYNRKHFPVGEFKVDADQIDKIKDFKWSRMSNGYISTGKGKSCILLHRFITNCPKGMVVDHINHNVSDNRIANLRVCTQRENMENCEYLERRRKK